MRRLIVLLCSRLEQQIVAENGFCFCKVNGDHGLVDKMWDVAPHEAPRLPMIYAVGWDLTNDDHWHALYRRYVRQALTQAQTLKLSNYSWCYALFQHQVSMEVLCAVEKEDLTLQRAWREEMQRIAAGVTPFLAKIDQYVATDVRDVDMDWRTRPSHIPVANYGNVPIWPQAMLQEFRPIRELGEAVLTKLLVPDGNLTEEERAWLALGLNKIDCDKAFTYAMHYLPAAYWRLVANQAAKQTTIKQNQILNPFDLIASEYDAWYDAPDGRGIFNVEVACLQQVMSPQSGRWLEVGVGSGRFAAALGIAEGLDPSAAMLALAEQRGIRTVKAVGECIPYADQTFDGILMTTALCFISDPSQVLTEGRRVLKTAGRIVIGMIPSDSSWGQLYARKGAAGHPIYAVATFRTVEDVIALAVDAGFEMLKAHSCLMCPPEALDATEQPKEGIVPGAGFAAVSFTRTLGA